MDRRIPLVISVVLLVVLAQVVMGETDEAVGGGMPDIMFSPDNSSIDLLFRPNLSYVGTGWNEPIPAWRLETNARGLREEPFSISPPNGTARVLVLGGSITAGMFVNRSDRYTDIVERRLNSELPGDYQVLTVAVPGWGMKDFYTYLEERGITFDPDVVIVAFSEEDVISIDDRRSFQETVRAEYNITSGSPGFNERVFEESQEYRRSVNWTDSPLQHYLEEILALNRDRCVSTVLFESSRFDPVFFRNAWNVSRWAEEQDVPFIRNSARFDTEPREAWVVGKGYGHYNEEGHRWAAEALGDELLPLLRDDSRLTVAESGCAG